MRMGREMTTQIDWAVITPSYNLDFERCKLLCSSMDAFLGGPWHHSIVVDPVDLPLFAPLAGPRRTVVNKADILPKGMRFVGNVPFMRLGRLWWSWRHGPIFGWQMQQYVKIMMASYVKQDAMMFLDSDIFFLKPFDIQTFSRAGKIRFSSEESPLESDNKMKSTSLKLLGLSASEATKCAYDDPIITWHRPTAVAMQDYLSKLHNKPWHEAIGAKIMFSEYMLYIMFVNYVQKSNPHLYEDNTIYCKTLWTKEAAKTTDIADFCSSLKPEQVAVCIQSLIGIPIKVYADELQQAIRRKR
jgi:Family of unknown function (DUF6492)